VPGLLRDDRDALAIVHAYAWSWYGTKRVSASWAINGTTTWSTDWQELDTESL